MVYCGTDVVEVIRLSPIDNLNEVHFISMSKSADNAIFRVEFCCDPNWCYEFYLTNNSDYERVKFNIMEAIFECETASDLLTVLSGTFEDGFEDILVNGECCGECCCGECECE